MEVQDNLKHALETTHSIAVGLGNIKRLINPHSKVSRRSRSRIKQLESELHAFSRYVPSSPSTGPGQHLVLSPDPSIPRHSVSPVRQRRTLSRCLFRDGHRVTLSKAGKHLVSQYLSEEASTPPLFRSTDALHKHSLLIRRQHRSKGLLLEPSEHKHVTRGVSHNEEPLVLPTFQEFTEANGVSQFVKKGSAELVYRLDKAIERVERLDGKLDKLAFRSAVKSVPRRRNGMMIRNQTTQKLTESKMGTKLRKIRETISLLYEPTGQVPPEQKTLKQQAESFRCKQDKVANNVIERANQYKYISMKTRIGLISQAPRKPLSREQSLAQFDQYKRSVDMNLRYQTYQVHQQGLAYVSCLHTLAKNKVEPGEAELLLLEIWRQVLLRGWTLTEQCLEHVLDVFTEAEMNSAAFQTLFQHVRDSLE